MADQRLPIVDSDDGVWGVILRQYLMKEHYDDGTNNAANGGHQKITIRPGTTSAGTAPLKFTSGALMTTAETGAMEYDGTGYYVTPSSATRKRLAMYDTSGATVTFTIAMRQMNSNVFRSVRQVTCSRLPVVFHRGRQASSARH